MKTPFAFLLVFAFLANAFVLKAAEVPAKLLDNKYNKIGLPVGDFGQVDKMIEQFSKDDKQHILKILNKKGVTLYEVSFALYYLSIIELHEGNVETGMKYMHIAAEQYLNPVALSEMARIHYHGSEELHHIFPKEHLDDVDLDYEKDLEKSFVTLNLAFEIAHHITKTHHNPHILKMVSRDGVELLERFTFKNEADGLKEGEQAETLKADLKKDLEMLAQYKAMYDGM